MHACLDTWLLLPFFLIGWLAVVELLYVCVVFLTIIIFLIFFFKGIVALVKRNVTSCIQDLGFVDGGFWRSECRNGWLVELILVM